ncbi:MAG: NAD(P)/FAD-dependent oxidoreductase [Chloroflexia bacterium]
MRVVIVGAGPAGVTVARTLREEGFAGEIVLLSAEPYPPYAPPAMVESFMTGQEVHFWQGRDFPERAGLDWRPATTVAAVRPRERSILTAAGEELAYDRLVLATGSRLFAPIPGVDKPGVYNFKSLSAAEALVEEVRQGRARRAVIVGAGFIGIEIALLLAHLGVEVTQVEMMDRVMPGMLDGETAAVVLRAVRERGIEVLLHTSARAFVGEPRASAVELADGRLLPAELLIAATGVRPNIEFLAGSGIETRTGVLVDDYLRTNAPDVYAAGDIAEARDRLTGELRVHPIFPNAVAQGRVVAYNLLGYAIPYEGAERMNSLKHLGVPVIAAGYAEGDQVLRSMWRDTLRTLYLRDGRLRGFQLAGDIRAAGVLRVLLNRQIDVRPLLPGLLAPGFGVGQLVGSGAEILSGIL